MKAKLLYWLDVAMFRDCWRYRRTYGSGGGEHVSSWMSRDTAHLLAGKEDDFFSGPGVVEYKHNTREASGSVKEVWL